MNKNDLRLTIEGIDMTLNIIIGIFGIAALTIGGLIIKTFI